MNVKVKVYYVYTVYFIKSIYILSYIFYKKHAYNRHDVAMLTLLFGQPCKMDQVDANALMVAAIRFPLELRICQSILQFPNLRFLRELQMCSIILEMKFAYAAAFYTPVCLQPGAGCIKLLITFLITIL